MPAGAGTETGRGSLRRRIERAVAEANEAEARADEARLREAVGSSVREGLREGSRGGLRRRIESAQASSSSGSSGSDPLMKTLRRHWAKGHVTSANAVPACTSGDHGGGHARRARDRQSSALQITL